LPHKGSLERAGGGIYIYIYISPLSIYIEREKWRKSGSAKLPVKKFADKSAGEG